MVRPDYQYSNLFFFLKLYRLCSNATIYVLLCKKTLFTIVESVNGFAANELSLKPTILFLFERKDRSRENDGDLLELFLFLKKNKFSFLFNYDQFNKSNFIYFPKLFIFIKISCSIFLLYLIFGILLSQMIKVLKRGSNYVSSLCVRLDR